MNAIKIVEKPKTIKLSNGEEFSFKLTMRALTALEDKYGSVDKAFAALQSNSVSAVATLLHVGIQSTNKNITYDYVLDNIDFADITRVATDLGALITASMPTTEQSGVVQNLDDPPTT